MPTISAFDAKTRFGELLDRVSRGEEIVITKHDRPVARIIPEGRPTLPELREAVNQIRAFRQTLATDSAFAPLSDDEIREARDASRPGQ